MTACATCLGSRLVGLPYGAPDDYEVIERPCPTCRPGEWPKGFPGLAFHYTDRSVWSIEPTGTFVGRAAEDGRRRAGVAPL